MGDRYSLTTPSGAYFIRARRFAYILYCFFNVSNIIDVVEKVIENNNYIFFNSNYRIRRNKHRLRLKKKLGRGKMSTNLFL